jgi:predicted outer membrane lipoprotein
MSHPSTHPAPLLRRRWLLGAVLAVAAGLFAIGVHAEADVHREAVGPTAAVSTATVPAEKGESGESGEAGEKAAAAAPAAVEVGHDEQAESAPLGINLESTPLVLAGVVVSLSLAFATWRWDRRWLLLTVGIFATAFGVLDALELVRQARRSAVLLTMVAATVAVLHLGAMVLARARRAAIA